MRIERYSIHGFEPQEQTHHASHIQYHITDQFLRDIDKYPKHLLYELQKIHQTKKAFYLQHLDDFKSGIWCFVEGYKNNQSLNHLKHKVPCWIAEVPNDIECYDCNWTKLTTISDTDVLWGGCFIPERELHKITNIQRKRKTA